MAINRIVYFGPPCGPYSPENFPRLVDKIGAEMTRRGIPSKCTLEKPTPRDPHSSVEKYHFPDAGIGIQYESSRDDLGRCTVWLMSMDEGNHKTLREIIVEADNKESVEFRSSF